MKGQVRAFWLNALIITVTVTIWITIAAGIAAGITAAVAVSRSSSSSSGSKPASGPTYSPSAQISDVDMLTYCEQFNGGPLPAEIADKCHADD